MKNVKSIAIDRCGVIRYYLNGKIHREDGPAVEWANGDKSWYLNGKKVNGYDLFKYKIKQILNESFKI